MINEVTLIGRLTKDVEIRKTQNNSSVARITVACNRKYNNEETDFINCTVWRQSADFLAKYASKGDLIAVMGHITTGSYDNAQGEKVYTFEVTAEEVKIISKAQAREKAKDLVEPEERKEAFTAPSLNVEPDDLPFY